MIRHLRVETISRLPSYQPKFLVDQIRAACKFEGVAAQFRPELVTMALGNLFTKDTPGFGRPGNSEKMQPELEAAA